MAPTLFTIVLALLAACAGILALIFIVVPVFKGIGWLIAHVFGFIFGEIGDVLRIIGAVVTTVIFIPLVLLNIIIGRWSAAAHFGAAIQQELARIGRAVYRVTIGHPARLLGLHALTEGIEQRIPEAMAKAPTSDKPSRRTGQFDGYRIIGSLRGGGSGAKLYIAEPDQQKLAAFARAGRPGVDQVVIKSFSLRDGSSLPQIVRESRALEAAKKMGLVLEHELNDQRFFYVTPYVPGEGLNEVTHRLHDASGPGGLAARQLREGLGYLADLAQTLERYHRGGLWHKDVKPDNIIVFDGRAHLVDLGLVTPLRSAMTLTTHGTEYFRDPELVRMALKGVKVHEVDGQKFDVYAAGAVLFSVIENSFPAHGGLSQVTKRCPESVRWIIRRAMAEYDRRYATMSELYADLQTVLAAADPFAVKPKDLPSLSGYEPAPEPAPADEEPIYVAAAAATPRPAPPAAHAPAEAGVAAPAPGPRTKPALRVTDWWRGRYIQEGVGATSRPAQAAAPRMRPAPVRPRAVGRRTAREQLQNARRRVDSARERANARMSRHGRYSNSPNVGVGVAVMAFLGVCVVGGLGVIFSGLSQGRMSSQVNVHVNEDGPEGGAQTLLRHADELATRARAAGRELANGVIAATVAAEKANKAASIVRAVEEEKRAAEGDPRKWLVLDDVKQRAGRETGELVGAKLELLDRFGFVLEVSDVDLLASARKTIGVGQPSDSATQERLRRWIGEHDDALAGVVWIVWSDRGDHPVFEVYGEGDRAHEVKWVLENSLR